VKSSGALYTFGSGAHGRLGHGIEEDCTVPTPVDTLQRVHVLMASCGLAHTVILSASGELYSCKLLLLYAHVKRI
jgi:alpha-tubulin suppressor-like RCC1 family protein